MFKTGLYQVSNWGGLSERTEAVTRFPLPPQSLFVPTGGSRPVPCQVLVLVIFRNKWQDGPHTIPSFTRASRCVGHLAQLGRDTGLPPSLTAETCGILQSQQVQGPSSV